MYGPFAYTLVKACCTLVTLCIHISQDLLHLGDTHKNCHLSRLKQTASSLLAASMLDIPCGYAMQGVTCGCEAAPAYAAALSQAVASGGCGANGNVVARE
jgi:hypothetical protein